MEPTMQGWVRYSTSIHRNICCINYLIGPAVRIEPIGERQVYLSRSTGRPSQFIDLYSQPLYKPILGIFSTEQPLRMTCITRGRHPLLLKHAAKQGELYLEMFRTIMAWAYSIMV